MPITVIGDSTLDVTVRPAEAPRAGGDVPASISLAPGGQGANVAVRLARAGIDVRLATAIGGNLLGHAGVAGNVVSLALPAGSYLTDELLRMLDCKEQQQAAKATDDAIRGGVGTEVAWKSETRPNVTGKSKVTGSEQLADGGQCVTVTDVVIVDGEETTVPKKMCRAKGASGYARV